jgi:hypothetical protein
VRVGDSSQVNFKITHMKKSKVLPLLALALLLVGMTGRYAYAAEKSSGDHKKSEKVFSREERKERRENKEHFRGEERGDKRESSQDQDDVTGETVMDNDEGVGV